MDGARKFAGPAKEERNDGRLPPGWVRCASKSKMGSYYYFNTESGKSSWKRPVEEMGCTERQVSERSHSSSSNRPCLNLAAGDVGYRLRNTDRNQKERAFSSTGSQGHPQASSFVNESSSNPSRKGGRNIWPQSFEKCKTVLGNVDKDLFGRSKVNQRISKLKSIEQRPSNVSSNYKVAAGTIEYHGKNACSVGINCKEKVENKKEGVNKADKQILGQKRAMSITKSDHSKNSSGQSSEKKVKAALPSELPLYEVSAKGVNVVSRSSAAAAVASRKQQGNQRTSTEECPKTNSTKAGQNFISLGRGLNHSKSTLLPERSCQKSISIDRGKHKVDTNPFVMKVKSSGLNTQLSSIAKGSPCTVGKRLPNPPQDCSRTQNTLNPFIQGGKDHTIIQQGESGRQNQVLDTDSLMDDSENRSQNCFRPGQGINFKASVQNHRLVQDAYDFDLESMDIDDIQSQHIILKEIEEMRYSHNSLQHLKDPVRTQFSELEHVNSTLHMEGNLFIILDTNILLSHLNFVKDLIDYPIPGKGPPNLIVPWIVFQELDSLKNHSESKRHTTVGEGEEMKEELVSRVARQAISFLKSKLQQRHPRLRGETVTEAKEVLNDFLEETNDDRILHCCLVYRGKVMDDRNVILLSDDKNLCAKAIVHGIKSFSKKGLIDGLRDLFESGKIVVHGSQFNEYCKELEVQKVIAERLKKADEFACELKCIIREAFSTVVEQEMKAAYGELWLEIVAIKPPWTLQDTMSLLDKHWIAVFGHVIDRRLYETLKQLRKLMENESRREDALQTVKEVIECSLVLCQAFGLRSSYNDMMPKCLAALTVLQQSCQSFLDEPRALPAPGPVAGLSAVEGGGVNNAAALNKADSSGTLESNVPHSGVIDTFNVIWAAVTKVSSLVFDALDYPNPFADDETTMSNVTIRRTEAVQLLSTLCPCLTQVVGGIKSVLETPNPQNIIYGILHTAVCDFMVKIVRQSCSITVSELKEFCVDQLTRNALIQGLSHLDRTLAMLQHCTSRAVIT